MPNRPPLWLAILIPIALAGAPPPPKTRAFGVEEKPEEILQKGPGLKERYALLIGISKYANPALSLSFAAADAVSLQKILLDPEIGAYNPDNVRLLTDEQANRKNIVSALNSWLKNRVKPEDSVVIFYSGHGALGNGNEAYWVTHDADVEDLGSSAISNKEISTMIAGLSAKRRITLIDSCYSEATAKKYRALVPTSVFDQFKGTGVVTITASTGQQKSVELNGHGAFTFHLLDALQGKGDLNDNGVVELDEIWSYLNEKVQRTAADAGNKQTPVLMSERMEHGFPVTVNPARNVQPMMVALKAMYAEGQLNLDEIADAERVLVKREGSPELRQIYKGLSEKALAVSYFRQLRGVLSGGGVAAAAGAAAPAPGASPDRGPAVAVPGMPTASGAELESFRVAEAANSTDGWMRFLTQYAGGYLSGAARTRYDELDKKKVEQAVYALARKSDTEKTWEAFLALYPNSATVNEAERRKSELKNARESETNAFRLAETKNSDVAWERYLKEFPGGQLAILAEDRLETMRRIAKEKEDNSYGRAMRGATLEEYDRYLNEYPSGRYSDEISKKKLELAKRLEEERERKAELDAYTAAKTGDTIASWGGYLAKYAKALHTEEALRRTEQLKWVAFADVAVIPAGSFNMGSEQNKEEKPVHRVEVDGFLLMKAEVTNAQFAKFAQETNHRRPPDPAWAKGYATTHADLPVLGVAYDDAVAFCKWLAQKTGAVVRLPTEAEWEYAAVGGKDNLAYPWGFEKPKVKARYNGNSPPGAKTAAANAYAPNAFGLVNMSGNAAEWVHDYYSETFYRASPKRNPSGPPAGLERVLRGGSYKTGENEVRCASREKRKPAEPGEDAGFRALIEPPKK